MSDHLHDHDHGDGTQHRCDDAIAQLQAFLDAFDAVRAGALGTAA